MEINITLSSEDAERLFLVKRLRGHDDLTAQEFAQAFFEHTLRQQYPAALVFDDDGNLVPTPTIETWNLNGVEYARLKFGDVDGDVIDGAPCHDCGVKVGELHVPGCDAEICPRCGRQFISCRCKKTGDALKFHYRTL